MLGTKRSVNETLSQITFFELPTELWLLNSCLSCKITFDIVPLVLLELQLDMDMDAIEYGRLLIPEDGTPSTSDTMFDKCLARNEFVFSSKNDKIIRTL